MLTSDSTEPENESAPSAPARTVIMEPDFSQPPKPIAEFVNRADFPKCLIGENVDIGGVGGVVIEIVKQSIKVQSAEGSMQSFNFNRLKTLYGPKPEPVPEPEPMPVSRPVERPRTFAKSAPTPPAAPPRVYIADPNFNQPVLQISEFTGLADFPKCAYGAHVEINGFVGVVVEIVKDSIKVQSPDGALRSYNAPVLRKLFAGV